METIYLDMNFNSNNLADSVCAIGFFDGFHLGHQELLKKVLNEEIELKKAVITFEQSPKDYVLNKKNSELMTLEDKIDYLATLKLDYLFILKLDEKLMKLSANDFIAKFIKKLNIKKLVCGYDFTFGFEGKGNVELLKELQDNYELIVIPPIQYNKTKISSTLIRKYLKQGEIAKVNELLGRNYLIKGKIIKGRQIGRTIGYPTANVESDRYLLPSIGVYGGYFIINNIKYKAMISVGYNPTFLALDKPSLEAYIIGFNGDIYNQIGIVEFTFKLRDEVHFSSKDELIMQLKKDQIAIENKLL